MTYTWKVMPYHHQWALEADWWTPQKGNQKSTEWEVCMKWYGIRYWLDDPQGPPLHCSKDTSTPKESVFHTPKKVELSLSFWMANLIIVNELAHYVRHWCLSLTVCWFFFLRKNRNSKKISPLFATTMTKTTSLLLIMFVPSGLTAWHWTTKSESRAWIWCTFYARPMTHTIICAHKWP